MHLATLSAFASIIGLARWPSIHWELARAYISAEPGGRSALEAIFLGLNVYLGNYLPRWTHSDVSECHSYSGVYRRIQQLPASNLDNHIRNHAGSLWWP
jgi:hypothetical protein